MKKFCKKIFYDYTFEMDLLDGLTNYIISKQEGEFPGPLLVQPEVKTSPRVDRINEIMEELADPDQPIGHSAAQLDFLEKLMQLILKLSKAVLSTKQTTSQKK